MIRILYDFDESKILNSKYYSISKKEVEVINGDFEIEVIKKSRLLIDLHFLGGGYDSVCFIENMNQSFYIIEPANGLIVSYQMIEGLIRYEEEREKRNINGFTFGALMDETIFRHHRNDDEIMVGGTITNYPKVEENIIILKYPNSTFEWKCKYIDFVPELLRFGERMMHLYDRLLPDFKEYALYPKLKAMLLDDNILRQNYGHLMEFDNLGKSFLDYISPPFDGM
jgi:hypothetical protein